MPTYIVTRKTDGAEMIRYCSSQVVEQINADFYPQADFDHVEFIENAVPPAPTSIKITKLAFRQRFTLQEKAALEIAALDVPTAPMEQRALAATLRANQADVQAATYIDLMRPDTRAGVVALEQYGLIAAGRALEILDTPPTEEEIYRD